MSKQTPKGRQPIKENEDKKMSDIFLAFVNPVLAPYKNPELVSRHPEKINDVFELGMIVWNLSFLSDTINRTEMVLMIKNIFYQTCPNSELEIDNIVHILLDRKEKKFSNNDKLISDFKYKIRKGILTMTVFWADPEELIEEFTRFNEKPDPS